MGGKETQGNGYAGAAGLALAKVLADPAVWDKLENSGFLTSFEELAQDIASDSVLTLDSPETVLKLCVGDGVAPLELIFGLSPLIKGIDGAKRLRAMDQPTRNALIAVCYALADRAVRETLAAHGEALLPNGAQFHASDKDIAALIAATWIQHSTGKKLNVGLSIDDGKPTVPGALEVPNAALEYGNSLADTPLRALEQYFFAEATRSEPFIPQAEQGKRLDRLTELKDPLREIYFRRNVVKTIKNAIEHKYGQSHDLMLVANHGTAGKEHFLSPNDVREALQTRFGVPIAIYSEHCPADERRELEELAKALAIGIADIMRDVALLYGRVKVFNGTSANPETTAHNSRETDMPITTLTVSYAAADETLWDLLRPQLQGRLRAHSNPLMKKLSIWTFREIAGGQNDDPAIQEKFQAETSGGLLCVSVDACASSYIQQSEWPVFRDSGGKVLKRFVATMLTPIDDQNMDLGVLKRIGANATQLMHLSYEGKRYSWSDCVDHGAENGGSKRLATLFVAKLTDDLQTQLFPTTAP